MPEGVKLKQQVLKTSLTAYPSGLKTTSPIGAEFKTEATTTQITAPL